MFPSLHKNVVFCCYILFLLLPCLELALLLLGYRPFHQVAFQIEASPKHCIIPHQRLGFALHPGQYEVTLNQGLEYTVTHHSDSLRVTSFSKNNAIQQPSIWFFGCSYTYGMGISDSLSFPFLVQQKLPGVNTKNFGVPGYGTVQSYLQLQQRIKQGQQPNIVIINYADFHDERNALTPAYRRDLFLGYQRSNTTVKALMHDARVPFVKAEGSGYQIVYCNWDSIYQNWQYRETFAFVNFLQDLRDQRKTKCINKAAITSYIFQQIKTLCDQHSIRLIVTGLTSTTETRNLLASLQDSGIATHDISVDLTLDEYHNAPYDDHPSALAHAIFAQRIVRYLNQEH